MKVYGCRTCGGVEKSDERVPSEPCICCGETNWIYVREHEEPANNLKRIAELEALLREALPYIDDAADAHSIMSESACTDACRDLVKRVRSEISKR